LKILIFLRPEILAGKGKYTVKADVYSIAFVLWEIVVKVLTGVYQVIYGNVIANCKASIWGISGISKRYSIFASCM
jgi:hypothetical protein